jgi:hypothetical protein
MSVNTGRNGRRQTRPADDLSHIVRWTAAGLIAAASIPFLAYGLPHTSTTEATGAPAPHVRSVADVTRSADEELATRTVPVQPSR